jgi:aspartate-semialdehyde dehydrogenase
VLGATGLVGQRVIDMLVERELAFDSIRLLATSRSAGAEINVGGQMVTVEEVTGESFSGLDLCFFAASAGASRRYAPLAIREGAVVIDKSSAFRMDKDVPLVVPEVNSHHLRAHRGIVCSPNCSTIQMVVALKPLDVAIGLRRVIAATYQSVSGTGKDAVDELQTQSRDVLDGKHARPTVYPRQIAFNVIPHIDDFSAGYSGEEWKMANETRKILDRPDLAITATCVRVPVFVGHCEALLVETQRQTSPEEIADVLSASRGIKVTRDDSQYPVPLDCVGSDDVLVGRIRRDASHENAFWLWVVADNLRKGAATNAVQIAETLDELGLYGGIA